MIAVILEAEPREGEVDSYFDIAGELRPLLDRIDGFISVERFESVAKSGRYLSLSFWRDEKAVAQWRNMAAHRKAQAEGRRGLFRDYRLRIAEVVRDYGLNDRAEAPADSQAIHIEQDA